LLHPTWSFEKMTTRRVVLQHAVNLVVTRSAAGTAARPTLSPWQETWDDLYIEVARQAQVPGQPLVTAEEAWYLLRIAPSLWRQWLELFRTAGCREIAVFAAVAPMDRLMLALQALEAEIAEQDTTP
jgi:hypothetical protein